MIFLLTLSVQCLPVLQSQGQTFRSHLKNTSPHALQSTVSVHPRTTAEVTDVSSSATELKDQLPEAITTPLEAIASPSEAPLQPP